MGLHRLSLRIRKPNPASLISFSTQDITLLALFLKRPIPTWLLQPVCTRICVSTLKTSVSSFLRTLPCNSPISIRFSWKTQAQSRSAPKHLIKPFVHIGKQEAEEHLFLMGMQTELSLCPVWKWPSDPCSRARWLPSWHAGTSQPATTSAARKT